MQCMQIIKIKSRNDQTYRDFFICNKVWNYLTMTLSFARAHSRSIKHERAQLYAHFITTFLPLRM